MSWFYRFEQISRDGSVCSKEEASNGQCYGGYARLADRIRRGKMGAGDTMDIHASFFLIAGNTLTSSPLYDFFKHQIASNLMNFLEPDVVVSKIFEFYLYQLKIFI